MTSRSLPNSIDRIGRDVVINYWRPGGSDLCCPGMIKSIPMGGHPRQKMIMS
jgi:hypothetical protein